MASVTIKSKDGNSEHVTVETWQAWKKRSGPHAAFAVQTGEQENDVIIIDSMVEMQSLPEGDFMAEKLERSTVPNEQFQRRLRAARVGAWKVV